MSFVMGLCSPASLAYLFLPWARQPTAGVTVADELGGPGGEATELGVRHLWFRCPETINLGGKLSERLSGEKMFVAGCADLRWIAEGCRILVQNGLEPLSLSPGTVDLVNTMIERYRNIGLICHTGSTRLWYNKQYTFNLDKLTYVLSLLRTLLTQHPDLYPGATRSAALVVRFDPFG